MPVSPPDDPDEQQPGLFDHDQEPQPVGEIINDGYEPSGLDEFAAVRPPFSDGKP